jgi:hypothetical protein
VGPEDAVQLLRRATNEPFELVGRLQGGETGAHEVRGPGGERLVLKWDTDARSQELRRAAVVLTDRLRAEAGWPVVEQDVLEVDGCLLVLQQFLGGREPDILTNAMTDQLLGLHAARLGLSDAPSSRPWADRLVETLVHGGHGYCLHESLRRHSAGTADLVGEVEAFGCSLSGSDLLGADIVHWDLHTGNLLVDEHGISGVVDTDFCDVGDAAFDLVMLALTSHAVECEEGVRGRLAEAALEPLPERRRRAYLGHLFIRLLDWPIRRGAEGEVELWLNLVSWCRAQGYF